MPVTWIPIRGQFDFTETEVIFHGREIQLPVPPTPTGNPEIDKIASSDVGQALSSHRFSEGELRAQVTLTSFDALTSAEIMLGFDPGPDNFISVGVGGGGSMFALRAFRNDPSARFAGWTILAAAGDSRNIKAGVPYNLLVRVRGSEVTLSVDGIEVLSAALQTPLPNRNVGVLLLGKSDIKITNFSVTQTKPTAFVVMQFTPPYDDLYKSVIRPACEAHGLEAFRADEADSPGFVLSDIAREIVRSKIVIAEVTPVNANVYYEVGFAHALGKPTILIADKGTKLPFDIAAMRTIFYENSIGGKERVEAQLRRYLTNIVLGKQA